MHGTALRISHVSVDLQNIDAASVTHKFVPMEDMPVASIPSHPSDGREFLTAVHDHFEHGHGSAEALAKAHQRVAGVFGVVLCAGFKLKQKQGLACRLLHRVQP